MGFSWRFSLIVCLFISIVFASVGIIGQAQAETSSPAVSLFDEMPLVRQVGTEQAILVVAARLFEGRASEVDDVKIDDSFEDPFEDPFEKQAMEDANDPWEGFNSAMFTFNYHLDRYVLKPAAHGYDWIVPSEVQGSLVNVFRNASIVSRFMNSLFQGKISVAGTEMSRFLLNSTLGLGGLFDVAQDRFDIDRPDGEDTGQTLAVAGVESGPYLVIPFLGPTTVRGAFGQLGDAALNPLNYFVPFVPNVAARGTEILNERSQNLDTFEGLEESTVDLYGAVRSGYLQRRAKDIAE